jgi:hypothetical protein
MAAAVFVLLAFTAACGASTEVPPAGTISQPLATPLTDGARAADASQGPCEVMEEAQSFKPSSPANPLNPEQFVGEVANFSVEITLKFAEVAPDELKDEMEILVSYYLRQYEEFKAGKETTPASAEVKAAEAAQEAWAKANCPNVTFD